MDIVPFKHVLHRLKTNIIHTQYHHYPCINLGKSVYKDLLSTSFQTIVSSHLVNIQVCKMMKVSLMFLVIFAIADTDGNEICKDTLKALIEARNDRFQRDLVLLKSKVAKDHKKMQDQIQQIGSGNSEYIVVLPPMCYFISNCLGTNCLLHLEINNTNK